MKRIGIRELKNHLSSYLKLVKNGECIIITDHNKTIAEIRQPSAGKSEDKKDNHQKQKIEAYLDKLKSESKLRRASRSYSLVDSLKPMKKKATDYKWQGIYQKVSEDRF
jgi:antitoxin (DNA-binding transcriptional repressor) of toxin-antitoxin stability system